MEARERERGEYLGSQSDKAQAVADLKGRSPVPERSSVFVPKREYTDEEIDRMSADKEMALKLFGRNNIEDRQGSSGGYVVRPERLERRVRRIKLSPAGNSLVNIANVSSRRTRKPVIAWCRT